MCIRDSIPAPAGDPDEVLQMLIANLDYSDYLGRLGIGRVFSGTLNFGDTVAICKLDGSQHSTRITKLYSFEGLKRVDETVGRPGDLLAIAGVEGITIGETVTLSLIHISRSSWKYRAAWQGVAMWTWC